MTSATDGHGFFFFFFSQISAYRWWLLLLELYPQLTSIYCITTPLGTLWYSESGLGIIRYPLVRVGPATGCGAREEMMRDSLI